MRLCKIAIWAVLILLIAIAAAILVVVNPFGPSPLNDYKVDGQLSLDGIIQPVRICRDDNGMAYIYAQNVEDLLMAVTNGINKAIRQWSNRRACRPIGEIY